MDWISIAVGVIVLGAILGLVYWASRPRPTEPMVDDVDYLEPASENSASENSASENVEAAPDPVVHRVPHATASAGWSRNRLNEQARNGNDRPNERQP